MVYKVDSYLKKAPWSPQGGRMAVTACAILMLHVAVIWPDAAQPFLNFLPAGCCHVFVELPGVI